jgi:hypothetical protein
MFVFIVFDHLLHNILNVSLPLKDLKIRQPAVYEVLRNSFHKLDQHFKFPQEVEFTIEEGSLYILEVFIKIAFISWSY